MSTRWARHIQRIVYRRASRRLRGSFNASLDGFSYPRGTVPHKLLNTGTPHTAFALDFLRTRVAETLIVRPQGVLYPVRDLLVS